MKCKTVDPNQMPRNVWKARIETQCRFIPELKKRCTLHDAGGAGMVTIPRMVLLRMLGMVLVTMLGEVVLVMMLGMVLMMKH